MKKLFLLASVVLLLNPVIISAKSLDELQEIEENDYVVEEYVEEDITINEQDIYYNPVAEYMKHYEPITKENMDFAVTKMSPVLQIIGDLTGIILVLVVGLIFLITVIDLLYLAVPILRPTLCNMNRQLVSDEARQVLEQQAPQMPMQMAMPQPQQPKADKLVIFEYFKKRVLFILIFAIAIIVLFSSILTNSGINIAELGIKLLDKLNGQMANIEI